MRHAPKLLVAAVLGLVSLLELLPSVAPQFDFLQRVEWITYDWRVRQAAQHTTEVAPNLGAVFVDDDGLKLVNEKLGYAWPWPRKLDGMLLSKLRQAGAKAVAFDILFAELHAPNPDEDVQLSDGRSIRSDYFFAQNLRRSSNVVLAAFGETKGDRWHVVPPNDLFRTNAYAIGHATSDQDSDGVLRRAVAFKDDPESGRLWHMGIILAAMDLGLDLEHAEVHPDRIILKGTNGVQRIIPTDDQHAFYIDWQLAWNDKRIAKAGFHDVLGLTGETVGDWTNRLVVVGSVGAGNNITDVGSTPLDKTTYLVSKHWNVANSIITNQFIERTPLLVNLILIWVLGLGTAALTMRKLHAPWPSIWTAVLGAAYILVAVGLFMQFRLWIPIVLPVGGGLLLTHLCAVTYQVIFEQKEKRRVKGVFSKLVSPNVVNELLDSETLNLGGSRREITVFFSDVRGFTQLTDLSQVQAEEHVRKHGLTGAEADKYFDQNASATINTVNTYLATIADQIKKHNGTLDKYMGDCVMAFWGAPTPNERHAVDCVLAAIDAQRGMAQLNVQRDQENKRRTAENEERAARGEDPLPLLPLLSLGTGINTGLAIVGLMGSDAHILNYTVFGREVNLASRLEGVSGRGRIIIGEATYLALQKYAPELAATCIEQARVQVKGIAQAVRNFEVPWRETPPASPAE